MGLYIIMAVCMCVHTHVCLLQLNSPSTILHFSCTFSWSDGGSGRNLHSLMEGLWQLCDEWYSTLTSLVCRFSVAVMRAMQYALLPSFLVIPPLQLLSVFLGCLLFFLYNMYTEPHAVVLHRQKSKCSYYYIDKRIKLATPTYIHKIYYTIHRASRLLLAVQIR